MSSIPSGSDGAAPVAPTASPSFAVSTPASSLQSSFSFASAAAAASSSSDCALPSVSGSGFGSFSGHNPPDSSGFGSTAFGFGSLPANASGADFGFGPMAGGEVGGFPFASSSTAASLPGASGGGFGGASLGWPDSVAASFTSDAAPSDEWGVTAQFAAKKEADRFPPSTGRVYSSDPNKQAATEALVAALQVACTANAPHRALFVDALSSAESARLICWDAPVNLFVSWTSWKGTLLSYFAKVMLASTDRTLPFPDSEDTDVLDRELGDEAFGFLIDAVRGTRFENRRLEHAYVEDEPVLIHVVRPTGSTARLDRRCALLRVLLEDSGCAPMLRVASHSCQLPLELVVSEWKANSPAEESACVDAMQLICKHAPSQRPWALQLLIKHTAPGVLLRWLLGHCEDELRSMVWSQQDVEEASQGCKYRTRPRLCAAILQRLKQWQQDDTERQAAQALASLPASSSSSPSSASSLCPASPSLCALQSWLRSALASVPSLLVVPQWMPSQRLRLSPVAVSSLCAVAPGLSWSQLAEAPAGYYSQMSSDSFLSLVLAHSKHDGLRDALAQRIRVLTAQLQAGDRSAALQSVLDPCNLLVVSAESLLPTLTVLVNSVLFLHLNPPDEFESTALAVATELLVELLTAVRAVQPPDARDGLVFAPPRHPFDVLLPGFDRRPQSTVALAELLHEHGCHRNAQGHLLVHQLIHAPGHLETLRLWLSPPCVRFSMPNDWMTEDLTPSGSQCALEGGPRLCVADLAVDATIVLSSFLSPGAIQSLVAVIRCAMDWWAATQQPKIARALQAHLIADLVPEVMSFLVPESALTASRAASVVVAPSAASTAALSRLFVQLQRGPVSQADVLEQVASIMAHRIDEDEAAAGTEILRRMHAIDCAHIDHSYGHAADL